MNVAKPFLDVFSADPSRPAIHEAGGRAIDCGGLRERAAAVAAQLRKLGLAPGDRVVLQIPNGVELAASVIGTLLAGGVAVLCEPGLGDEVYLSRIRAAKARWVLVHPIVRLVNRVPGLRKVLRRFEMDVPPTVPTGGDTKEITISRTALDRLVSQGSGAAPVEIAERGDDQDAVMIFTGGTTSRPKGVRLSHRAIDHYLSHIASVVSDVPISSFLADTPQQVLYALRLGKTAWITKGRTQKRARYAGGLIAEGRVDAYFGSPYVWVEMMRMGKARGRPRTLPDTLRIVLLGAAPVTVDFLATLGGRLHPSTRMLVIYGLTEVGPVSAVSGKDKLAWKGDGDLVGEPFPAVDVRIDGADRDDGIGEVVIRSPSLYTGYLGTPDRKTDEGLRTGDLGRLVEVKGKTMLALMGRQKDMIIRAAVNLYPSTLEPAIRAIRGEDGAPLFKECALIGLWSETRQDEEVVLCYQPEQGRHDLSLELLRRPVEEATGPDGAPDRYLEVDPIPVTGRQNKVDKGALRRVAAERFGLGSSPIRDDGRRSSHAAGGGA